MYVAEEEFMPNPVALAVPRASPIKPIFDMFTQQCWAAGLIKNWIEKHQPNGAKCDALYARDTNPLESDELTFQDLHQMFVLCLILLAGAASHHFILEIKALLTRALSH